MTVNVFHRLRTRERKIKGRDRVNHGVVRSLICQDDVQFEKIWQSKSSSSVYDNKRLYFDNYRTCLTGCGFEGKPSLLYKLPKCPTSEKIEDALICQYHPEEVTHETKPHLIALTKDNWIILYDLNNGRVLQKVYLGSRHNYKYLNWNDAGISFVAKTTKTQTTCTMRQAEVQSNVLLTMAVFTVYPLKLTACFEVEKRIFGDDITGAHLDGGNILFTLHQRDIVKFHSFERILQENLQDAVKLGDDIPTEAGECKVGQAPLGVPVTLRIKEKPPVLLEVSSHDHDVQFGGIPWHFMMSPLAKLDPDTVRVFSLATKEEAKNGTLERNTLATGIPGAVFHFDGSDRIINPRIRSMGVYKIHQAEDGKCELVLDHEIRPWPFEDRLSLDEEARDFRPRRIAFGRGGRPYVESHEMFDEDGLYSVLTSQMICNFTCDDEMDLMAVTMPTEDADINQGYVTLHDNATGRPLKVISIPGEWDDTVEHEVSIDLDTLVHTFKNQSGKWICELYRAQRKKFLKEKLSKKAQNVKGHRKGRRR